MHQSLGNSVGVLVRLAIAALVISLVCSMELFSKRIWFKPSWTEWSRLNTAFFLMVVMATGDFEAMTLAISKAFSKHFSLSSRT